MKKTALTLVVLLATTPLYALDAYPKTTIAEEGTATWCQYCPNAYAGLEIVHGQFDYAKFISVRHYETTGSYGTPETDARNDFNGVSGLPTVVFDGLTKVVGAGTATANTGVPYLTIVAGTTLKPSPIQVEIDSFDPVTGDVSATVTMHSTTASLDNDTLLFILVEDDLGFTPPPIVAYTTHATRDLVYETVSLNGAGSTTTVSTSFNIDPTWVTANLRAAVLVQRVSNRDVLQAASTYPQPTYSVHAMVPFDKTVIGPSSTTYESDLLTVMNIATIDSFTISAVMDEAPTGWTVAFKDDVGTIHTDPLVFLLGTDEQEDFRVVLNVGSPGSARFHLEVTSPNLTSPITIPFIYIADDIDVLIVDDDGGDTYENYFREALETGGKSYGVWDTSSEPLTQQVADTFDVLVWNVGFSSPTLDDADKVFLADFLDDGKALFLSGQDIGWDLNDPNANPDPTWYHGYLHANYIRDDTNEWNIFGVPGDPITDGLDLYINGGTGASNQSYPDEIEPYDADATLILEYQGNYGAAIRSTDSVSGAHVVYLGFGFEGIDNAQDRHDLLVPAVRWLQGIVFEDGFESSDTSAWSGVSP